MLLLRLGGGLVEDVVTEPAAPAGQVIEGYVSRPDRVSAGVTARASGEPVVVLDETSPTGGVVSGVGGGGEPGV